MTDVTPNRSEEPVRNLLFVGRLPHLLMAKKLGRARVPTRARRHAGRRGFQPLWFSPSVAAR